MSGKRPSQRAHNAVVVQHLVLVRADGGRLAEVVLADFLQAVEDLTAIARFGSIVQRAVNRGKRRRPARSGFTGDKDLAELFQALTCRRIAFKGDPSAPDPAMRIPHLREGFWRALGRTQPLKSDEAYEVLGEMVCLTAEGVKKKLRKLR